MEIDSWFSRGLFLIGLPLVIARLVLSLARAPVCMIIINSKYCVTFCSRGEVMSSWPSHRLFVVLELQPMLTGTVAVVICKPSTTTTHYQYSDFRVRVLREIHAENPR